MLTAYCINFLSANEELFSKRVYHVQIGPVPLLLCLRDPQTESPTNPPCIHRHKTVYFILFGIMSNIVVSNTPVSC